MENAVLKKFKVMVLMHKYADLSDKGVERWLPSEGEDEEDAVFRLRDLLEEERKKDAQENGVREGNAKFVGKGGQVLYIGATFRSQVRSADTAAPKKFVRSKQPVRTTTRERGSYSPGRHYTSEELRQAAITDLESDIRSAVRDGQPDYAEQCRRELAKLRAS